MVMLHLIHEYARHNGHADFLRAGIDGTVGLEPGGAQSVVGTASAK
jgi:hypothetical protein